MSPEQGESRGEARESGGTTRLRLIDGRQVPFRLGREEWQFYYGGARREEASERTERAELAGVIALEPGPAGPTREPKTKEDRKATAKIYRQGAHLYVGMQEAMEAGTNELDAVEKAIEADPVLLEDAGSDALQAAFRMSLVEDVLKRYHPDFDRRSRGERIDLLIRGAQHMDAAWRALDAFHEFVQAGRVGGRARRKANDPQQDVRAAELKDALDLYHREIGDILRVPPTEAEDSHQGGHRQVGHMIERGRKLFINNLGEGGYQRHIEAVRADLRQRHALNDRDQLGLHLTETIAQLKGLSPEEAEAARPTFERFVYKRFPQED